MRLLEIRIAIVMAFALICAILVGAYQDYTFDDTPPVFFHHVDTVNSPLQFGEWVKVKIWRDKMRDDCPVISNRRAQNTQSGVTFDIPNGRWSGGEVNTQYLDFEYDTSRLPVGTYVLIVDLDYQCPGFVYSVQQPVTFFTIEAD